MRIEINIRSTRIVNRSKFIKFADNLLPFIQSNSFLVTSTTTTNHQQQAK